MKKSKKEINRKFVLIGDGFCGKSTLIHSFYNRKFIDKYEPTIFDTFTVTTDIYKKNVRLEIMDSAGQDEFSRVRPLSYPEVDCIILCFSIDSRESSQNIIELWLPEIKHYCSNKIPIVLVGCKIDLRFDNSIINNQFILKQEHLNNQLDSNSQQLKNTQLSSPQLTNQQFNHSLNYGLFKTLALYCCRHGRQCTCYHSRICSTNCINLKRKVNQLSNSSSYLLQSTKSSSTVTTTSSNTSLLCKDNLIRCNRALIDNKLRNSSNTEEDSNISSSEDNEEECMNIITNSSLSLNCNLQDKNSLNNNYTNHYNNSIYRHNQSLLNTLIHQQVEYQLQQQQQQQCKISLNNHSLNSSESDESELIETTTNNLEDIELNDDNFKINSPVDHLESSIEETKNQSNLIKNLNSNNCTRLIKGYKNFTNIDDNNNRSLNNKTNQNKINLELNKKDKRIFKNSSLKYKLSTMLGVNHTNSTNTLYSSKSELKFTNLFQNRKLNSTNSNTNLQFKSSSSLIYKSKTDTKLNNFKNQSISQLITTEEGIKLRDKIGASAYVECSSRMNIGVDEVFKTALGLTLKHQLRFNLLDMFKSKK